MTTTRIGIVGLGSQGSLYARLIRQGRVPPARLAALCSPNPKSRHLDIHRMLAEEVDVPLMTDYQAFLGSGVIDALIITTPHYLHPQMAIDALEAGVHVLVDKPVGVYAKDAQRLAAAAAAHPNLRVGVLYNQRTNPLYRDLKTLIDSGEMGRLRHTSWTITSWWRPDAYYASSDWRATWDGEGGGVLVNQAPHQLDLWGWLCGAPERVFARMGFGFRRDIPVEDEVSALVDFGNGATGAFITGTNDMVGTDRLEILFDRGKIIVTDSREVSIWHLGEDEREIARSMSPQDAALAPSGALDLSAFWQTETRSYTSRWGEQHATLITDFCRSLDQGTPLLAPLDAGLAQLRLANAMYYSAWTGTDVALAELDDEAYLSLLNERIAAEGGRPRS